MNQKPFENIWDAARVKALLELHRYPMQLIQGEPWIRWIDQRGGICLVRGRLGSFPMAPHLHELLEHILGSPYAPITQYAAELSISRRTYTNYLAELTEILISCLNGWDTVNLEQSAPVSTEFSLPAPLTSFVGMEKMLETGCQLVQQSEVRLITITGPGGSGKTRLAVKIAETAQQNFIDGVLFVSLETVADAQQVEKEIARSIGFGQSFSQGFSQGFSLDIDSNCDFSYLAELKKTFKDRHQLLLLDGFEHVLDAAPLVTSLLTAAPGLKIIVTSRAALILYGEHRISAPALETPNEMPAEKQHLSVEEASAFSAPRLFADRARAVQPAFTFTEENIGDVCAICRRLGGLPLAIELAAARADRFSPQQMNQLLEEPWSFLAGGPRDRPLRQQSLWNSIDWSFQLLTEAEKDLFCRLGLYEGEWRLSEVTATGETDLVQKTHESLVLKNLIEMVPETEEARYRMPRFYRNYALQRLKEKESDQGPVGIEK